MEIVKNHEMLETSGKSCERHEDVGKILKMLQNHENVEQTLNIFGTLVKMLGDILNMFGKS